ncbi:MAG: hypothetical protein MUF48_05815 [Pirellulaceae bacterium]|jgi:hypothetical protein|nr:hypothetical protein [Pirellulaceae bacterium]
MKLFPLAISAAVCLLAAPGVTLGQLSQPVAPPTVAPELRHTNGRPAGDAATGPSGQNLVAQAAQRLLLLPGIEARTRQRVNLFGQSLVGSGTYLQLTRGPRMMLRLDLKLQVGMRSVSWQQISDGDTFWVSRTEDQRTSLTRVNVRRLRDVASRIGPADLPPPPTLWMALGGLPKLLSALESHFTFDPPQASMIGDLPVWRVDGHWKPATLASLLPDQGAAILAGEPLDLAELPPHLPHGVTLILGRDQVIPLFPYGISYFRHVAVDPSTPGATRRQAMVTWELFEVRLRQDLEPSMFDYRPHDNQEVEERTDQYIARLEAAMPAARQVPPAAEDARQAAGNATR